MLNTWVSSLLERFFSFDLAYWGTNQTELVISSKEKIKDVAAIQGKRCSCQFQWWQQEYLQLPLSWRLGKCDKSFFCFRQNPLKLSNLKFLTTSNYNWRNRMCSPKPTLPSVSTEGWDATGTSLQNKQPRKDSTPGIPGVLLNILGLFSY